MVYLQSGIGFGFEALRERSEAIEKLPLPVAPLDKKGRSRLTIMSGIVW
jgi:hypothetical protein